MKTKLPIIIMDPIIKKLFCTLTQNIKEVNVYYYLVRRSQ